MFFLKMNKKAIHLVLVLVVFLSLTGFSPRQQAEELVINITQIDTSNFPEVTVYVTVRDGEGQPVGLDPARIQLLENGEAIPLEQIEGAGEVDPFTVLLAMDISGSMLYAGKLEAAKEAAKLFVEQLRPNDKVGLLAFHSEIFYTQPITADRGLITKAIDGLEGDEDTVLYDALVEGINILSEVGGRKAIVAITDGLDTLSQSTPEDVLGAIGPSGLSISTIGLGDPDQDLAEYSAIDEEALLYLAENAGGAYGYANDQESLTELYGSYAVAFKSEYQLSYTSPSALRDGVNRALSVNIADAPEAVIEADAETTLTYNPGGLVPEVSQPVPIMTFGAIMLGLAALLLVPGGVKLVMKSVKKDSPKTRAAPKKKSRIKLKD